MAVVHQVEQYEGTVEQERFFLSACLFVSESRKPRYLWLNTNEIVILN